MQETLECISDLIKRCLLPELTQDLDSALIQTKHFETYHSLLQQELPLLFDLLQQNLELLVSNGNASQAEIVSLLTVLLCELTANQTIYKLDAAHLNQNAIRLLQRLLPLPAHSEALVFSYYEQKLNKAHWKRQLGAVHGFLNYLQCKCETLNGEKLSTHWLNFCLAVALNVRECADPNYKHLGVRIFILILDHASLTEIRELNVHSVIYDDVSRDVYNMDTIATTADIWNCLCNCLDKYQDIDSFTWNQCDDMLERLLSNVTLAPNSLVSICLLEFITKLGYYFTINRQEIATKLAKDLTQPDVADECRYACEANTSYTSFRWAKSILELFIIESHKLMESIDICKKLLAEMHRCYLICILPIPLQVTYTHLTGFFEKFTAVLMQAIAVHERDADIVASVQEFIRTFYLQLQRTPYCDKNVELVKFRNAFEKLLAYVLDLNNKVQMIN